MNLKDNEIAELVSILTKIARKYHDYGCLRILISQVILKALKENKVEKPHYLEDNEIEISQH